ncbi:MAG: type B 50S ribosomal protein L31 [Microthrixaceae bacterium]
MKADIHPNYRHVVFQDTSSGDRILTRSTVETDETVLWEDGNEYPLAKVEISAFTHPFFTGQMKIIDTAGRVERFEKRYGRRTRKGAAVAASAAEQSDSAAE